MNAQERHKIIERELTRMLHRGDLVKLDRYVNGEDWARVIVNGVIGWVWLSYIGEQ